MMTAFGRATLTAVLATAFAREPALANELCTATATRATAAVYAPYQTHAGAIDPSGPRLHAGGTLDEVTIYDVGRASGQRVLCVRVGACYPAQFLKLTNCTIAPGPTIDTSSNTAMYDLAPIRSKFTAAQLERNDVQHELNALGVSSAAANGAAAEYVAHPGSLCAKTIGAALHGDASARRALTSGSICPD